MNEVISFINNNIKLNSEEKLVVAVSGGPDSMCLLHLVMNIFSHDKIVCAHVNHSVRPESKDEAKFLEKFCKDNNIIFEYMKIQEYSNDNFHNDARKKRYDFFNKILKKYNSKYLLTAHHADDLIETVIMRLVRGSSLSGYKGFTRTLITNNIIILRPLITVTKDEILSYCDKNNIKYVTDKSNLSDKYTRNRIRNKILPVLKAENSNVHEKFIKFSNDLEEVHNYLNAIADKKIKKIYTNKVLNINLFKKENIIIQKEIINKILQKIYNEDIVLIDDSNIKDIFELINSNKSNIVINLPNSIVVRKEYNNVIIEESIIKAEYKYKLDEKVLLLNNKVIEKVKNIPNNSNDVCLLNTKEVSLPLYIRTKVDGDYIELLNTKGKQKVKDIFIDKKIPLDDRKTWPILVDSNNNLLWVPGLKKSKYDKSKTQNYDIIIWYH